MVGLVVVVLILLVPDVVFGFTVGFVTGFVTGFAAAFFFASSSALFLAASLEA